MFICIVDKCVDKLLINLYCIIIIKLYVLYWHMIYMYIIYVYGVYVCLLYSKYEEVRK